MARIEQRTNKSGQTVYRIRAQVNGREYQRTWPAKGEPPIPSGWTVKRAQKEAERQAALFEDACRRGLVSTDRRTLADYAAYVIEFKSASNNIKPSTIEGYQRLLARIKTDAIGDKRITEIRARDLNQLYNRLMGDGQNLRTGGKLSPKTIREYHALLSSVFSTAAREGLIQTNPAQYATPPKVTRTEADYYTPEQIASILDAMENEPLYWRAMTYVFIGSGARRSEVAGLQWCDIDFKNSVIHIRHAVTYTPAGGLHLGTPKTGRENALTMPGEVMQVLREWRTEQEAIQGAVHLMGFVFSLDRPTIPIHPDSITTYYRRLGQRYNLGNIHPHAFRHTQASIILQAGDIVAASARLGHSQTSTTLNIYGHLMPTKDQQAAALVESTLFKSRG